jgi:membrane-associated protease RseP (regulator of RpoE activity)
MSQPYYFPPPVPEAYRPTVVQQLPPAQPREVTFGRLFLHALLLGLTALTTTGIGSLLFLSELALDGLGRALMAGVLFSFTLLMILGAHEMGHYLACHWYGVRATLPYFIPAPIGIGTFGAFIKIKSPIPNRRALFDIGIAGPLAGFVFAIPAAIVAAYYSAGTPLFALTGEFPVFHDPPLFLLLHKLFDLPRNLEINPIWLASWVGLLVTSLNLLPVGQLDGGHVIYALFGWRGHRFIARAIYLSVVTLAVYSYLRGGWLGWIVYAVLLTLMLGIGHPPVVDEIEPLGRARLVVAVIGLLVFLLCFIPFPITY